MVVDQFLNADRYTGGDKNIEIAMNSIREYAAKEDLADGSYVIVPDEVILNVVSMNSHSRESAKMEIHEKFMDIHYIIQGAERCYVSPLAEDVEKYYDAEKDLALWETEDTFNVRVGEGEFYMVWPMEPHCPLCNEGAEDIPVRKMICKVRPAR